MRRPREPRAGAAVGGGGSVSFEISQRCRKNAQEQGYHPCGSILIEVLHIAPQARTNRADRHMTRTERKTSLTCERSPPRRIPRREEQAHHTLEACPSLAGVVSLTRQLLLVSLLPPMYCFQKHSLQPSLPTGSTHRQEKKPEEWKRCAMMVVSIASTTGNSCCYRRRCCCSPRPRAMEPLSQARRPG